MERIPVSGPWITKLEIEYVTDAVTNAWYANANSYNDRFERAFAGAVDRKFAICLPSCTSALHLALLALKIGPGDEVVVPDLTWIATAAPITYVGATPVFADVDARSWCLDAHSFESVITARTKAVIPVDLYGNLPDMEAIESIAARYSVAVIEDAAEAAGARYRLRPAGSFGRVSTFSFHGSKTLTTGEGGMLATDDAELRARCLFLRDHGRHPGDKSFRSTEVGYKYRMSSMQAALGLAQTERLDELVSRKRQIFGWYAEGLAGIDGISLNETAPDVRNAYWMTTVIVDKSFDLTSDELIREMDAFGVDCRPFFPPLSALQAYAGLRSAEEARRRNVVSYGLSPYGINLPSGFNMDEDRVARVCASLRRILARARVLEAADV